MKCFEKHEPKGFSGDASASNFFVIALSCGCEGVLGAAMFSILLLLPTHRGIFYIMEFLCCEIYEPFFPADNISFLFHLITRDISSI